MISSRVNKSSSGFKPKFKPRAPARPVPAPVKEVQFQPETPQSPITQPLNSPAEQPNPEPLNEPVKAKLIDHLPQIQQNIQPQSSATPIVQLNIRSLIYSKFKQGKESSAEVRRKQTRKIRQMAQKETSVDTFVTASPQVTAPPPPENFGPRLIIVDGKVTVDKSSLQVEIARPQDETEQSEAVEETGGRHITSASFGKKYTKIVWDKDAIKCLYEGISYFGTDFSLIAVYIRAYCEHLGTVNQRHVRLRFAHENKARADAVTAAFRNKMIPGAQVMQKMKEIAPPRVSTIVETTPELQEPQEIVKKRKVKLAVTPPPSVIDVKVPEQIEQPEMPKMLKVRPVVGMPFSSFNTLMGPARPLARGSGAPKRFNPSVLAKKRKI